MRRTLRWQILIEVFTVATVVYAIKTKQSHGRFVGVPFEFRVPTVKRIRKRWWNRDDPRLFTEHVFGVGWSLNLYQICSKLGLISEDSEA